MLLIAVSIYSYLFYNQFAGINFLLFSIILVVLLIIKDKSLLNSTKFLMAAAGGVITGACIAWHGNELSIAANFISLALISALSINRESSVAVALMHSAFSFFTSIIFMCIDAMKRNKKRLLTGKSKSKLSLWLLPILITIIFFFLYMGSNPLFRNVVEQINLDFIAIDWLGFTFIGFILMYAFFYHKFIPWLINKEKSEGNTISKDEDQPNGIFGRQLDIDDENYSGIILFGLLNALLVVVNILDFNFMFFGRLPNEVISYSATLHQGIITLIISIIIAICIILFYFRGNLNFYPANKKLKTLAAIWIAQNIFMIIANVYRNQLYIDEYSLTFKRIGVYVWLLLALIGLITTYIKIRKVKSNWFLFRINGWIFYSVLVTCCLFNWTQLVTGFNISQALKKDKVLDAHYLVRLSDANIPRLLALANIPGIKMHYRKGNELSEELSSEEPQFRKMEIEEFQLELSEKITNFKEKCSAGGWQSWNIDDAKVKSVLRISELANR